MAERATIFQNVQIGVQAAVGTGVAADKKLQSLSIEPAVAIETSKFRAMGNKYPALVIPQKEYVKAKLRGVQTYTELIYPLSSVLSYAAPAVQGATTAYKWTFTTSSIAADSVKYFTVEQGSGVRAHKFIDGLVSSLELAWSRSGCEISGGEMIGASLEDGVAMTGTPTELELLPVLPTQVDIYLADTAAGLAAADPLERALSATWKIGNRFGPVFPLATAAGTGYAATVETEPSLACTLMMEADTEGMALLATMRAGTTKFMRVQAVGANIEDAYDLTLTVDTAVKVENISEFKDEDGLFAIEWQFAGVHDGTWGKSTQIEIINELSAL